MARELKFRAWDKAHGMVYQPAFGTMGDGNTIVLNELLAVPEQVKLMQYTGLKDKNGKEIYEGDIVEHMISGRKHRNDVVWSDLRCGWGEIYRNPLDLEIIGNIYENPDLLK